MQKTQTRQVAVSCFLAQRAGTWPQRGNTEAGFSLVRREGKLAHVGIQLTLIVLCADELATGHMAEKEAPSAGCTAEHAARAQPHAVQKTLVKLGVKIAERKLAIGYLRAGIVPALCLIPGGGIRAGPLEPKLIARGDIAHVCTGQFLAGFHSRGVCQRAAPDAMLLRR